MRGSAFDPALRASTTCFRVESRVGSKRGLRSWRQAAAGVCPGHSCPGSGPATPRLDSSRPLRDNCPTHLTVAGLLPNYRTPWASLGILLPYSVESSANRPKTTQSRKVMRLVHVWRADVALPPHRSFSICRLGPSRWGQDIR